MRRSLLGFVISITVLSAACGDKAASPLSPSALSPSFSPATTGATANGNVGPGVTAPVVGAGPIDEPEPPGDSDDGEATKEEIEGLIEALPPAAPGTLVVAGRTVTTDATTIIRKGDALKTFADLAIGQRVHVKGKSDGAAILATLIEIQNTQTDAPVNLNGTVEGLAGSALAFQFTIEGRLVQGDQLTEYVGDGNRSASFTDLKNSSRVEVKGQQKDGYVYAARIHVEKGEDPSPDESASFQGTLTAMTGAAPALTLTVGGKTVRTSAETTIERKGERWSFSDLRIGYVLHVEGMRRTDGSIDARTIQVKDNETSENVEIAGTVGSLSGSCPSVSFVVNGTPVVTNVSTAFSAGGCGGVRNGAKVEVKGAKQPDGKIVAAKVTMEDEAPKETPFEGKGEIGSLSGSCPSVNFALSIVGIVPGSSSVSVSTNGSTAFSGGGCGDLKNGIKVSVKGTKQADGKVLASKVEIHEIPSTSTSFEGKGTIGSLSGSCPSVSFTLSLSSVVPGTSSASVRTNGSTVFDGASCGALKNGAKVDVKGTKQSDGTVLASKVEIHEIPSTSTSFEGKGTIGGLSGSCPSISFTLSLSSIVPSSSSVSVSTNGSTKFSGVGCDGLKNGLKVFVKGTKGPDGKVTATKIEKS